MGDDLGKWQEKLHGFLDPAEDKPEHFAAIGRLITAFNGVDVILNMILRYQIGAETQVGRAIIGGMRTGDMLAAIQRLAKLREMTDAQLDELEALRQDIAAFKNVRDNVAHKVWAIRGEQMSFSNAHVSRFQDSAEFDIYAVSELNDLARYAPYLSERALALFPGAIYYGGKLPSRGKPALLQKKDRNQDKSRHDAR